MYFQRASLTQANQTRTAIATLILAATLFCAGCHNGDSDAGTVDSDNAAENDSSKSESSNIDTETKGSERKIVDLPEGVPIELASAYQESLKEDLSELDNILKLSMLSQEIAGQLLQTNPTAGHPMFIQSGQLLEEALAGGVEGLPPQIIAAVFFNQTIGHLAAGEKEEAFVSLGRSAEHGFGGVAAIENDPEFEVLRNHAGFDELLARVKENEKSQPSIESMVDFASMAEEDFENQQSYDFDLDAVDFDGNPMNLKSQRGKVVIVDFWGTWCGPCIQEVPEFIRLQEEYGEKGLQIFGLNAENKETEEEKIQEAKTFIDKLGINYPCALATQSMMQQVPQFQGFPTTLFFDKAGRVRVTAFGMRPYEYHEIIVQKLLSEVHEPEDDSTEFSDVVPPIPTPN